MGAKSLSIVIPVYNEVENLHPLYQETAAIVDRLDLPTQFIFVDDGSTDGSRAVLERLSAEDDRVTTVLFRRNFGQTAAMAAGIDTATGEVIITMDADQQNDPADIPLLIEKFDEGYDVVSGWRKDRQDKFLTRRLPSQIANWLISTITGVRLRDYGCTLKAYRAELIQQVRLYGEMHRFIPALAGWLGAEVIEIPVRHRPRTRGVSKYGLLRTFKVMLDLMTVKFMGSFSTKPIYVFGGSGFLFLLGGLVSGAVLIYLKLAEGVYMITSPLLQLTALLISLGVQLILIGLLAEFLVRVYFESQNKRTYTVKKTLYGRKL